MKQKEIGADEVTLLTRFISKASISAISGIGEMIGRKVEVRAISLRQLSPDSIYESLKDPDAILIGIDIQIQGDASGNMLIVYSQEVALGMVDLMMGNPLGQTKSLERLERSALAELGNLVAGFFLGSLSDDTDLMLEPSPPNLIIDKASVVLADTTKAYADSDSKAFVLQTAFGTKDREIQGNLLVIPTPPLLNALMGYASRG